MQDRRRSSANRQHRYCPSRQKGHRTAVVWWPHNFEATAPVARPVQRQKECRSRRDRRCADSHAVHVKRHADQAVGGDRQSASRQLSTRKSLPLEFLLLVKILSCIQEGIQQKLCQPQNAEKYWLSARFIYLKINRLVSANKSRRR